MVCRCGQVVEIRQAPRIGRAYNPPSISKRDSLDGSQTPGARVCLDYLRQNLLGLAADDYVDKGKRIEGLGIHGRCLWATKDDGPVRTGALDLGRQANGHWISIGQRGETNEIRIDLLDAISGAPEKLASRGCVLALRRLAKQPVQIADFGRDAGLLEHACQAENAER